MVEIYGGKIDGIYLFRRLYLRGNNNTKLKRGNKMEVVCKCGYEGHQIVQFSNEKVHRQLWEDKYGGYFTWIKDLDNNHSTTLNWACPICGAILAQKRNFNNYTFKESDMRRRLQSNSWDNKRWLREREKNTVKA
jgi:hypothetical protein